ncbi:DUF2155 domain-containing protein [Actibacterium ureilyticum]|uniref:DUF2155 domain-containing protein n=1 Tax=Actibacterium ureilyticum TaxID=1590614 RepID=UPI000BAAC454|nr:DUF2155 domain-containing protein [Actibacterium ureilyticum]
MRALVLALATLLGGAGMAPAQEAATTAPGAVLRALDKSTGIVTDIELRAGQQTKHGLLDIALDECRYPQGNAAGDAFAHVTLRDAREATVLFNGWMIASSPALNALDHPRYDVWVMRCITS